MNRGRRRRPWSWVGGGGGRVAGRRRCLPVGLRAVSGGAVSGGAVSRCAVTGGGVPRPYASPSAGRRRYPGRRGSCSPWRPPLSADLAVILCATAFQDQRETAERPGDPPAPGAAEVSRRCPWSDSNRHDDSFRDPPLPLGYRGGVIISSHRAVTAGPAGAKWWPPPPELVLFARISYLPIRPLSQASADAARWSSQTRARPGPASPRIPSSAVAGAAQARSVRRVVLAQDRHARTSRPAPSSSSTSAPSGRGPAASGNR